MELNIRVVVITVILKEMKSIHVSFAVLQIIMDTILNNPATNWYTDSRQTIEQLYGDDADMFCDILAATSPRKQVKVNWGMAQHIYERYKHDGYIDCQGLMGSHIPNVLRAINREPLHGYKVPAFAANLKGDMNRVTIDLWVLRYFGLKQTRIRRKEYYRLEKAIQLLAKHRGMKSAEYQAMIWCKAVTKADRTPVSYADMV